MKFFINEFIVLENKTTVVIYYYSAWFVFNFQNRLTKQKKTGKEKL